MFYAGIRDARFSPQAKPLNLGAYFPDFNKNLPVFTYLGKISPLKKTFAFVEAASSLPKGKFYLLFFTEKGRLCIQLKNLLRQHGLLNNSYLLSFQPPCRIPSIITASTCIVAPESKEYPYLPKGTHGSKICFEAMLCGKCCIIGREMSKKEFYCHCKDKKHFLAVDPDNLIDFRKKLRIVLDNSSLVNRIGCNARKFIDSRMSALDNNVEIFLKNLKLTILKNR